jgi:PAS domain-containing protein
MPQMPIELILLRQWASYLTMPIFIAGADENLLFYNEAAEGLLGRQYDEAAEMPLEELPTMFQICTADGSPLPPNDFPLFVALRQHWPAHLPVRYRALDGVWRNVEVTAFPLEGQGGRHLGAVAIFWEAHGE